MGEGKLPLLPLPLAVVIEKLVLGDAKNPRDRRVHGPSPLDLGDRRTAGSFGVWDGERLHVYDAGDNTYFGQDVSEPLATFSVLNILAWDGPDEGGWASTCADGELVGQEEIARRPALHVSCPGITSVGAVEVWVDAETGLRLKVVSLAEQATGFPVRAPFGLAPGGSIEVTQVEIDPAFAPDELAFTPPKGAVRPAELPPPPATSLAIGQEVPTWTLPLLSGGELDLASLRGKPTAVYIWATWCPPCVGDLLTAFDEEYAARGGQVNLVSVALLDVTADDAALVEQNGYTLPVVTDEEGATGKLWGMQGIPTLVLLDVEGNVAGVYAGDLTAEKLREIISALAAGKPLPDVGGKTSEQLPAA